jgi:hypothetical protein
LSLSSFRHLPECLNRCIWSGNLAHRFIEDFIPSGIDALDCGYCCFVGNDADLLDRLAVGVETPMPLIIVLSRPGRAMVETFQSASAVVLPMAMACGEARNAMAGYSAWL